MQAQHNICLRKCVNYVTGSHRHQTYFATLDEQVSTENAVRLMDALVRQVF